MSKQKRSLTRGLIYFLITWAILRYFVMIPVNGWTMYNSPRIENEEELEFVFEREKKIQSVSIDNLKLMTSNDVKTSCVRQINDTICVIIHPSQMYEGVVVHEVRHLSNGQMKLGFGYFQKLLNIYYFEFETTWYTYKRVRKMKTNY